MPGTVVDGVRRRRIKNIVVDHINPIIDPAVGFISWDSFIEGLFCEAENLQALCKDCHKIKTKEETDIAKDRRAKDKLDSQFILGSGE